MAELTCVAVTSQRKTNSSCENTALTSAGLSCGAIVSGTMVERCLWAETGREEGLGCVEGLGGRPDGFGGSLGLRGGAELADGRGTNVAVETHRDGAGRRASWCVLRQARDADLDATEFMVEVFRGCWCWAASEVFG